MSFGWILISVKFDKQLLKGKVRRASKKSYRLVGSCFASPYPEIILVTKLMKGRDANKYFTNIVKFGNLILSSFMFTFFNDIQVLI